MKKKVFALLLSMFLIAGVYGYKTVTQVPQDESGVLVKFVSGTEYAQGEEGSTIIRVTNAFGIGITANECNVTIYYPNKTVWIDNQAMTQGGATGSWYKNWVTPYVSGIYEQYVECKVPLGAGVRTIANSKAFHVSEPLTLVNETGSAQVVVIS